jgi:hypothetical protein
VLKKTKQAESESKIKDDPAPSKKRRWLGLRRSEDSHEAGSEKQTPETEPPAEPGKKRRFSMRLSPPTTDNAAAEPKAKTAVSSTGKEQGEEKRRGGLGGWLRRDKTSESEKTAKPKPKAKTGSPKPAADQTEDVDLEDIDWNSLSKAERRRLRKQLKRRNRAA